MPLTAEVEAVVCAKHTTGKRSKSRLTISDDFSFVIISESPNLFSFTGTTPEPVLSGHERGAFGSQRQKDSRIL